MFHKKKNRLKVGLALSGGTALGIAHIGVIKALRENKIPIDCVAGTSAGAIAAACLAFDVPLEKMIEISRGMNWQSISEFGYSKLGINSNHPIRELMISALGDVKIEEARIPLAIVATDIDTGKEIIFHKGNLAQAIMASTCLPGIFIPVKIDGRKLVDGGLVENLPLSPLKKMGAEIKIGVNLKRNSKYIKIRNIFDVVANSYKILSESQNFLIPGRAEIIIEPNLGEFDSTNFRNFEVLLEEGYEATSRMMAEIKKQLKIDSFQKKNFIRKIIDFFKL
ncbi:MAG: patatin [Candidatus Moranbacteria bacterium CG23_combo_of_CG06-09_8_20_14_all_35_22]|nr:MAG: patatin [Candidatus Moranbacteria bacterium CG23_combo_of_CG06-09_8_20_14_all_35_22]